MVRIPLPNLLRRCDDDTLQAFLGGPALELILLLDASQSSRERLTKLILDLHGPVALLRNSEYRSRLLGFLKPAEAAELARILDLNGDPYEMLANLRLRQGSPREAAVFEYFGIPVPPDEVRERVPSDVTAEPVYALFPHQRRAAREIAEALQTYPRRVVLHMPTGSGKTRTAMSIICDYLREREPTLVVWLAFNEELCEQAASEFEDAWTYLGNRSVNVYRFWGDHSFDPAKGQDGIVIAGLAKLYSAATRSLSIINRLAQACSLVVFDEAHAAIATTYQVLTEALIVQHPRNAFVGLTATPGRTWNEIDIDERLAKFFNRKKVTLKIPGYSNPVDYLIDEEYLARVNFKPLFHEGGLELTENDYTELASAADIPLRILMKLSHDKVRNMALIYEIERLAETHNRIIVFCTTFIHSEIIAAVLQARGFNAHSVIHSTETYRRAQIIADFKNADDEVKILCNFGVLTTGFDAPRTSAALIARPTRSLVLYSQMVGRAIRGPRAGGNSTAEVVTVVDRGLPGFGSVSEAFMNWEDIWE